MQNRGWDTGNWEEALWDNFQELEAQLLESISTSGFCSFLFLSYIRLRNMLVLSLCLTVSSTAAFRKKKKGQLVLEWFSKWENYCSSERLHFKGKPNKGGNEVARWISTLSKESDQLNQTEKRQRIFNMYFVTCSFSDIQHPFKCYLVIQKLNYPGCK